MNEIKHNRNVSKENYLSIIYKNRDDDGKVKANLIADKLHISNAAVTDMLKKLSKDGYIKYQRYKNVSLTPEGELYSRNIVRKHRIWEVFLHRIVGVPWDKVHDEANNLEHSVSDELINRMEEMLDFPGFDVHGAPIPSKDGKVSKNKKEIPLLSLKRKQSGIVTRVNDYDSEFLRYIFQIGIDPGKEIYVNEILDFDKSLIVKIEGKEVNLSNTIAENIFVELKKMSSKKKL